MTKIYSDQRTVAEKSQITFAKTCLGVSKHVDHLAIYGELGIYPLYIDAIKSMLRYWQFIVLKSENILLKDAYNHILKTYETGESQWLNFAMIIKTLDSSSRRNDILPPSNKEIHVTISKLKKNFEVYWYNNLMSDTCRNSKHGRKLRTYRKFKNKFCKELYLTTITNSDWRRQLTRFRVSNHKLMIEIGRHKQLDVHDRICTKCALNTVEDECHFLLSCTAYGTERTKLFKTIHEVSPLIDNLTIDDQFIWLMGNQDKRIVLAVASYIFNAMKVRENH
jgi:hypothetical protein